MTLAVPISSQAETALREKALKAGQDIATYAAGVLERCSLQPLSITEISGPLSADFARSGMTEDELSELLEREKHEMRSARRAKAS